MKSLMELIGKGQTVACTRVSAQVLDYVTSDGFAFTVPVDDLGDGVFLSQDKATLFMRYVRKTRENKIVAGQGVASIGECVGKKGANQALHENAEGFHGGTVKMVCVKRGEVWCATKGGFEFPVPLTNMPAEGLKVNEAIDAQIDVQHWLNAQRAIVEAGRKGVELV